MACDEGLVQRIRDSLRDVANVHERRMFGGACLNSVTWPAEWKSA
jgi:hypothetical protein